MQAMQRMYAIMLSAGLVALGCGAQAAPGPSSSSSPGTASDGKPGETSGGESASRPGAGLTCGFEIAGADQLLDATDLVILGEMHGNYEMPGFTEELLCRALQRGSKVILGVEIPIDEQDTINAFVASDGSADAVSALTAGAFWHREAQDGRSGKAMVGLLDRVRQLRAAKQDIEVVAFDLSPRGGDGQARDAIMASNLERVREQHPGAVTVVLVGNVHARLAEGAPWDADYVPLAVHLTRTNPGLVSLNSEWSGGDTWVCTGPNPEDCGRRDWPGKMQGSARTIEFGEAARVTSKAGEVLYHGVYRVGQLTASEPAVEEALRAPGDGADPR